jgi:hypothetical protein
VNNIFGVEILEGFENLLYVICSLGLIKPPIGRVQQLLIDFSSCGKFQNEVNATFVPEEPIESTDVWMTQMGLDFNFASQLVFNAAFHELLLV